MPPGGGNGGGEPTSAEFVLNGYSLMGDPSIQQDQNGGVEGEGQVTISDGEMLFEDDDIVVIVAENVDADGNITGASVISQVIVYDSYADYLAGQVLYTYEGSNGQTATIDGSTSALGDTYLQFNANTLTSSDPNAPDLGQMFVAAGQNLNDVADGTPLVVDTVADIDYDGDGTIDPDEEGDGFFSSEVNELLVTCFARGTLIETPRGPRYIETLQVGDLVQTLDSGPQPIRWIGHRATAGDGKNAPIHFRPGAVGNHRNLRVSPNHRMLMRGAVAELMFGAEEVLVAAKHLVNDLTICRAPCAEIDYYHILLDSHEILFAEGAPAESLYLGEMALDTMGRETLDEVLDMFPELWFRGAQSPAPLSRPEIRGAEARALRRAS